MRPWYETWKGLINSFLDIFVYTLMGGLLGFIVNIVVAAVVIGLGYGETSFPMLLVVSPTLLGVLGGYVTLLADRAKDRNS